MGRPSSQESLHLHDILRPLLVPLNPRSKLEPSESNLQRWVSHTHDRVLRNLATTRALSQLHIQPIFAPNKTDRFVHRLSFRRHPTLQLFLELRSRIDRNRIVCEAHLLRGRAHGLVGRLRYDSAVEQSEPVGATDLPGERGKHTWRAAGSDSGEPHTQSVVAQCWTTPRVDSAWLGSVSAVQLHAD